ncbi:cytidylyltransferase family protein [Ilyonectria robusta]
MVTSPPAAMRRPDPKSLVSFFSRALSSFQSSPDAFRVLCTLPHASDPAPRRPVKPVDRLVVLDSSFNPPTRAHASMARAALEGGGGEGGRLVLLLSVNNADKAPKPASFPVRLGMMDAMGRELLEEMRARSGSEGHELEIDVAVTTMPFFHDKAQTITQSGFYTNPPATPPPTQTFLAGFDTLVRIFNPKYYGPSPPGATTSPMQRALGPFFAGARLRVTTRPDEQWGGADAQRAYVERLAQGGLEDVGGDGAWAARVDVVEGGAAEEDVSSSRVREVVQGGGDVDGLVGGEVKAWIEGEKLYRGERSGL